MNRTHPVLRSVAATCAALMVVVSTGCSSGPLDALVDRASDEIAQEGAEKLGDMMTGGDVDIEFGGVPDDFPSEVPLVSTNVVHSIQLSGDEGQGISLTVFDSGDPAAVAQTVRDSFAEWEEVAWAEMGGLVSGQFSTDDLFVIVGVLEEGEGTHVQYMVVRD